MSGSEHARPVWLTYDDYALSDVALALKARRGFVNAPKDAVEEVRRAVDHWHSDNGEGTIDDAVLRALGSPS